MKYFALCDAGSASLGPESMRQRGAMCAERETWPCCELLTGITSLVGLSRSTCLCFLLDLSVLSATALSHGCQSELCLCVLHFFLNWKGKINKQRSEKGTGIHLRILSSPYQQKGCEWYEFVTYKAKVCVFVATAFWMEALKCLWRLYL